MADYEFTLRGVRLPQGGQLVSYDRLFVAPDPAGVRELAPPPAMPRPLTYVLEAPGVFVMPDAAGIDVLVGAGVTATLGHADVQASGGVLDLTDCTGEITGGRGTLRNSRLLVKGGTFEVLDDPARPASSLYVLEDGQVTARAGRGRVDLGGGRAPLELGGQWQVALRHDRASLRGGLVTLRNQASGLFHLESIPTHRLALALFDDATAQVLLLGPLNESECQARVAGHATLVVDARDAKTTVPIEATDDARIDTGSRCVVRASGRAHVVARGTCKVYLADAATVEEIGDDVVLRDARVARAAS